jgi:glycosyltransferase involved in cell wall biosynthesis
MNVMIDARMVNEHLHGIGRYTYEIINNVSKEKDVHLKLLVNDLEMSKKIFNGINNIEFIKMKSKFLSLTEQIELPLIVNKYKKDALFHSPSFVSSPFIKCKMIMTIHDLNHLRFPQYYSKFHKYYYKYIVKTSALKCEKILTVSNFSKSEIVEWLKCDKNKVVVTYNGVDDKFKVIDDKDELDRVKQKYNLPDKFVLYIGNLKPHKNVETLVKAMKDVDNDARLIINGKPNESLTKIMNELDLSNRIQFIGYVEDDDLPIMYNLAKIFVFPSLYEGFGLPPLEAMKCGCPVIVPDSTAFPEVVGDAAIKIKNISVVKLTESINEALKNKKDYFQIIKKGIIQTQKFNWKYECEKIHKLYAHCSTND